ncbi:uncharacterized protein LOC132302695 isoform X3 [Cornus florida]|uniref:uncharacterized protein LOC132302695 isoform X3 n=1 Tax=Cornus florida TaxID=4283 RepID=UPI0028970425|nr:uncharacterized protein LOC132302695 isoform X3 [Cornus florida]
MISTLQIQKEDQPLTFSHCLRCRLRQNEAHDELYTSIPSISVFVHPLDFEIQDLFQGFCAILRSANLRIGPGEAH